MRKECNDTQDVPIWRYDTIYEVSYIDTKLFPTYGIRLSGPSYEKVIHDVSIYKETVDRMTSLFNKHQLYPCHFEDAIADLIP